MRTKVALPADEASLSRLLQALERELLEVSDEEILQAARDLGMDPLMKGSAVFEGVRYPTKPQLSDFFDLDSILKSRIEATRVGDSAKRKKSRAIKRWKPPINGEDSGDEH